MAVAATKPTRQPTRRGTDRTELLDRIFLLVVGAAGLAFLLPLLPIGGAVYGALYALRLRRRAVRVGAFVACLVPAVVLLLWAWKGAGMQPQEALGGYAAVQQRAIVWAARAARDGAAFPWREYGLAVWVYAVAGGGALGELAFVLHSLRGGAFPGETQRNESLTFRDAGDMARLPERQIAWALPRVLGRGVVSLLSAPPGLGKGWWTWAWLRAMQDGETFFGLEVRRPAGRRFGRERPLRVLWLTEEGQSFGEAARRFGIAPGLVTVLQRQEVQTTDWPEIVRLVRREAWRRRCAYVIVDTIRAWCPEAEHSNSHAADVMNLARKELAAPGLGVLFVHHDTKAGGEYGAGVAGPNNLVGSCDVLVELRRVRGDAGARRMLVSRRFGDMDVTARLDGARYVVDAPPEEEPAAGPPPVPTHLLTTLDAVRAAGAAGLETEAVQVATGGASTTVTRRLGALKELGLVDTRGAGVRGDPLVWFAPDVSPSGDKRPPTADPEYVRYLGSKAWAVRRAAVLERAGGHCEECGAETSDSELEVHHLNYSRLYAEGLTDLVGLCPACHRRAPHPNGRTA